MLHLNIVATCTDRKRGEIRDDLRLRDVPVADADARARHWWSRLGRANPLVRAEAGGVYLGESWNLVQELAQETRKAGWRVDVWVASAGYGLLSERTLINPYGCTFAETSEDQVALGQPARDRIAYHQLWWSTLAGLREHGEPVPTSLAALASRSPQSSVLLLSSPDYVRAMHADLVLAADRLRRPEQLSIISSGAGWAGDSLENNVLSVDDRTRSAWGGTMQALHARAALNLLGTPAALDRPFTAADLRDKYDSMVGDTPRPEKKNRIVLSDDEVVEYLKQALAQNPNAGWTKLLRALRDSGKACEQNRFRRQYSELSAPTVSPG